uniref:Uncharacterized protein n=1 Tax=Homalodisca liturata TaxID=320908 RepID=A0A1B6HVT7_9HEMI
MKYSFTYFSVFHLLKQYSSVSENSSHESVNCYNISMTDLDDLIIKNILHPERGKGNDLMKNTFTYYDILDDAKNFVDEGNPKGKKIMDEVGRDGPKWVKVKFDEDLLRCTYNWKSQDMTHFVAAIDATVELWESFFDYKLAHTSTNVTDFQRY